MKFNTTVLASAIAVALGPAMVAAQYDDAAAVLGPDPNGCSWKTALICASSLVGCGAACGAALVEEGVNPFADAGCASCVGATAGICAMCWGNSSPAGNSEVCYAAQNYPAPIPDACNAVATA